MHAFTAGADATAKWSTVTSCETKGALRLDAEFYQRLYLTYAHAVADGDSLQKRSTITHPTEVKRVYEHRGLQVLLAQNIRRNRLDFSATVYMPRSIESQIARNRLHHDDVVMTRSGANFGDAAVYKGDPPDIYACADCLIIRPRGVAGGYLATYFNTGVGRALLTRGAYGMAQPHIAPSYLYTMRIPRLAEPFQREIDDMVVQAYQSDERSKTLYAKAQALLLAQLGLAGSDPSEQLTYTLSFAEGGTAGRLDAEYHQPRYRRALETMARSGSTISDVAQLAKWRFQPRSGQPFEYIEIGDIGKAGHAVSRAVLGDEAPSRAQWIVKPGDVITSTVRPIRRLSALIGPEQDGYVCSSGFAVLRPTSIEPEVLLVYLRLPIVCEILDLHTSASMYPAISTADLLSMPVPVVPSKVRERVVELVHASRASRQDANDSLEEAKRRVERMILAGA